MQDANVEKDYPISFVHFSLFRKIVEKKQTGTLAFITQLGFAGRIPFHEGQLASHTVETPLKHFFTKPMQDAHWEEKKQDVLGSISPTVVVGNLLESLDWDERFCHNLAKMLSTLPAVRIESMPLQFDDYHLELCASLLYRQSLSSPDFRPADFLDGVISIDTLSIRLKVVVLAYVCGLMKRPLSRQKPTQKQHYGVGISSVASRIFQRIKGIKGKGS
ncbi:MAG: hypothetical protein Q9M22_01240 [Mariprofundaceae bacterium]|nr:hypothetical protein [Mariprofundaceae bacterium]